METPVSSEYSFVEPKLAADQRAFVEAQARFADSLLFAGLAEQDNALRLREANFLAARQLSLQLEMQQAFSALTQFLAAHAHNAQNFAEASQLFEELARHEAALGNTAAEAAAYRRAAVALHQRGQVAEEQKDFALAQHCYRKSLAIEEKLGDVSGAAASLHQLGRVAEEQRDFEAANDWYLRSLALSEKQASLTAMAATYGQLGILAAQQGRPVEGGRWLLRSIATYLQAGDKQGAARNSRNLLVFYRKASAEDKQELKVLLHESGLSTLND